MLDDIKMPNDISVQLQQPPQSSLRWIKPDYRCEIWTGERWIDLERLIQRLDRLEAERE